MSAAWACGWQGLRERPWLSHPHPAVSGALVASQGEDDSTPRPFRQRRVIQRLLVSRLAELRMGGEPGVGRGKGSEGADWQLES